MELLTFDQRSPGRLRPEMSCSRQLTWSSYCLHVLFTGSFTVSWNFDDIDIELTVSNTLTFDQRSLGPFRPGMWYYQLTPFLYSSQIFVYILCYNFVKIWIPTNLREHINVCSTFRKWTIHRELLRRWISNRKYIYHTEHLANSLARGKIVRREIAHASATNPVTCFERTLRREIANIRTVRGVKNQSMKTALPVDN